APVRTRAAVHPATVLGQDRAVDALGDHLEEAAAPVAAWLAKLSLLGSVPFSYLVPDPRMLPAESIRFFYVDQGWIDALVAGATSLAVHATADVALLSALRPRLGTAIDAHRAALGASPGGTAMTGVLIRSALVSGWPALVVRGTVGGAPLPVVRDDRPSPSVRVTLFEGVPDEVSLAEPYQGLLFGLEDGAVGPRNVTAKNVAGAQIANLTAVPPTYRAPGPDGVAGVLQVAPLASALETAVGLSAFSSNATVHWNGTALATTVVSPSRLNATVPANLIAIAGTASITVVDGATSDPAMFTIDPPLAIDSLEPFMVTAGGDAFTLEVDGVGFGSDAKVEWNGTALPTMVVSELEATAQVDANLIATAGTASITVTSGGQSTAPVQLPVVAPGPAVSELEPNIAPAGAAGFTLTVGGSGFEPGATVQWNGSALLTTFVSDSQVSAPVAASLIATPGTAQVTVVSGGIASKAQPFTIGAAGPQIGSFKEAVAIAGGTDFELVVRGINFGKDAAVNWNGTALTTTWDDADQVTAAVPASLITKEAQVPVTVKSGGAESPPAQFTVIAAQPGIGLLEPRTAVAGGPQFTLSVTGGFGAGDFAIQMVAAPEIQSFLPIKEQP
nr:IPT/TIG domain-containing protein [Actinomycetota bacterium]